MLGYSLVSASILFISCNAQNRPESSTAQERKETTIRKEVTTSTISGGTISTTLGNNIQCIFQAKNNHYWFGTQNSGVYRYDGHTLVQFTDKDGLSNNQVQTIQEDASGNIWFGTGAFGISRFDGKSMTTFTNLENLKSYNSSDKTSPVKSDDLWFFAGDGMYRYSDYAIIHFPLHESSFGSTNSQSPSNRLGPYAVYCSLKDTKGKRWFGTQSMGVCRYDPLASNKEGGDSFTWFTENGLAGPAVLALFEAKNGILWFGNNGSGLFRYDSTSGVMTNFTKEKGLDNEEFRKTGKTGPGTLARIYSINEDNNGNLWIGTADAGAWRYDGKTLKNYTIKDGLTSNAVTTIYNDKQGELWFGTGSDVCQFNGSTFSPFTIK